MAQISEAEQRAGRPTGSVSLLPVTKGQPPEVVQRASLLGVPALGENYLQECAAKDRLLRASGSTPVRWHLLGHLQRNKVRRATELFSCVESVDSVELAQRLSRAREGRARLQVLCEVELTGLPSRTGFSPAQLEREIGRLAQLEGIELDGLMTLAAPGRAQEAFSACRDLADRLRALSGCPLPTLSMGMSGDFREAIAGGSTRVRIGSLLFGDRVAGPG